LLPIAAATAKNIENAIDIPSTFCTLNKND